MLAGARERASECGVRMGCGRTAQTHSPASKPARYEDINLYSVKLHLFLSLSHSIPAAAA